MTQNQDAYPVQFTVEYPDRPLDRFSTFFRLIAAIPIVVIASLVGGGSSGGGLLYAPPLMILFRRKYPRWWFDWGVALLKFENRVAAYLFLLGDEYPSTDEEQTVHLTIPYPDVERDLHRWLPLVKWFLAIPHYLVLAVLTLVMVVVVLAAWIAILVTGRYPRDLFAFVVGTMRWWNRVIAYAFVFSTDRYPPFRFGP